jgi:shikimate kinase
MIVVLMGVTGSGKTTVGKRLVQQLGWRFVEGDDFHSPENIQKLDFVRKVRDGLIFCCKKETDCFHLCVATPKERRAIRWARSHWSST